MARTKDFAEVIRKELAGDIDLAEAVKRESFNANVAMQIYKARIDAGLTQTQLADRAQTTQPVISRLEDADYDGHSLNLLKRIGDALGRELHVELRQPVEETEKVLDWSFIMNWREIQAHWENSLMIGTEFTEDADELASAE